MGRRRRRGDGGARALPSPASILPSALGAGQSRVLDALDDPHMRLVVVHGPAGCGKTTLAVRVGLAALAAGEIARLIVIRPNVAVDDRDIGYLPGDMLGKMRPWVEPVLAVVRSVCGNEIAESLLLDGRLEVVPLAWVRGRTFLDAFVVVDEAQSITPNAMLSLVTRIGEGSRMVIAGDPDQADACGGGLDMLVAALERRRPTGATVVRLDERDVVRSPIVHELYRSGVVDELLGAIRPTACAHAA